ncbi:SCP-like protein [Ancylostoma duodenale]|uniref:SCP-like protein n=1 Tax=Ancylostoma duodenale TaxID=51022 RepID=A0A0C2FIP3_9BILA|nr:SCP-like protein [Ancylostoma duodenale]
MIHAKTTAVGCAEAKCVFKATAACFYNQPELQNGELIYTKGRPCVANDECKTYQPSTCANGFCVKGDPPTTPAESSSSETTPSSTSSESTTPSSTSSGSTTPTSTSSKSTTAAINQICPTNWGVNDKIRNKTLEAHNYRRSELAFGRVQKRNGNYYQSASNMIKLKYSCQLEVSARDHAVTCRNGPSSPSSRPNIEENVAQIPKNSVVNRVEAMRKAVISWWKTGRKEKPIGVALTFRAHHLDSPIRHFAMVGSIDLESHNLAVKDMSP